MNFKNLQKKASDILSKLNNDIMNIEVKKAKVEDNASYLVVFEIYLGQSIIFYYDSEFHFLDVKNIGDVNEYFNSEEESLAIKKEVCNVMELLGLEYNL